MKPTNYLFLISFIVFIQSTLGQTIKLNWIPKNGTTENKTGYEVIDADQNNIYFVNNKTFSPNSPIIMNRTSICKSDYSGKINKQINIPENYMISRVIPIKGGDFVSIVETYDKETKEYKKGLMFLERENLEVKYKFYFTYKKGDSFYKNLMFNSFKLNINYYENFMSFKEYIYPTPDQLANPLQNISISPDSSKIGILSLKEDDDNLICESSIFDIDGNSLWRKEISIESEAIKNDEKLSFYNCFDIKLNNNGSFFLNFNLSWGKVLKKSIIILNNKDVKEVNYFSGNKASYLFCNLTSAFTKNGNDLLLIFNNYKKDNPSKQVTYNYPNFHFEGKTSFIISENGHLEEKFINFDNVKRGNLEDGKVINLGNEKFNTFEKFLLPKRNGGFYQVEHFSIWKGLIIIDAGFLIYNIDEKGNFLNVSSLSTKSNFISEYKIYSNKSVIGNIINDKLYLLTGMNTNGKLGLETVLFKYDDKGFLNKTNIDLLQKNNDKNSWIITDNHYYPNLKSHSILLNNGWWIVNPTGVQNDSQIGVIKGIN